MNLDNSGNDILYSFEKGVHQKRYYPQLDGLKGITCFFIVFVHYYGRMGTDTFPLTFMPSIFVKNGGFFVELFFIISGFLSALSYKQRIPGLSLDEYLLGRLKRLYLPAVFATILDIIVRIIGMVSLRVSSRLTLIGIIKTLTFADTLIYGEEPFPTVLWYIHVLMVCYFVYYFIAKNKDSSCYIIKIVLFLAAGWVLFYKDISFPFLYKTLGRGYLAFSIGLLLYEFQNNCAKLKRVLISHILLLISVALSALVYAFSTEIILGDLHFSLIAFFFPVLFVSALNIKWLSMIIGCQPLKYLGKISMAIYLVHVPILNFFGIFLNPSYGLFYSNDSIIRFDTLLGFAIVMSTIIIIAIVWHHFIDEKAIKQIIEKKIH